MAKRSREFDVQYGADYERSQHYESQTRKVKGSLQTQRFAIFSRAASRMRRSRSVRLWMPWAEICSRMGSTSLLRNSSGGRSSNVAFIVRPQRADFCAGTL